MVTALIGGDIQLAFLPQANGIANVQSNLIRGLGVTGTKRMTALPDVPTALEQGFKGLEVGSWNAMFVPAGTPTDIVNAIQQTLAKVLADPKVRETMIQTGQEPVGDTPAAFAATFKADIARFAKVIDEAKIPAGLTGRVSRAARSGALQIRDRISGASLAIARRRRA